MRYLGPLLAALLASLALASTAGATATISAFEATSSDSRVGMHPDLETNITFQDAGNPETVRNAVVNLPEGMFGNPNALPKCSSADFALFRCAPVSQAGVITVRGNYQGVGDNLMGTAPLYVLESRSENETTRLGFIVPQINVPISIPVSLRTTTDYGVRLTVSEVTQQIPLAGLNMVVWGFPAHESHDDSRFAIGSPGKPANCPSSFDTECTGAHDAPIPVKPLTSNPSICTGNPLVVNLDVTTYQDPGNVAHAEDTYPPTTACEEQTFRPVFNVDVTNHSADSPSGLEIQLKAPQPLGFSASPAQIRSATLLLPEGLNINPDAADGQGACSDDQANFESEAPAECPDLSKIGNFDIESPALDGPLQGSLYFGEPKPGVQYRVFMIADGFGIHAKIVAEIHPDPLTGRLAMSVTDLPQVPFEGFNLHAFASDRALTATPTHCAIYDADSTFISWNDQLAPQTSQPVISIDSGPRGTSCPGVTRPFHPRLVAGMSTPVAGAFSNFHLTLDRDDGDQFLGDLQFRMPPGFTGDLRGISYCPEASILAAAAKLGRSEQAAPSCPASSQIGTTNVAAGPGSHPFHAVGRMYLAGPLKGAPLSLAAITPALAGPFDYGTVVVRVGLNVDPLTAQVTAVSDRVPSIIGGVPIRMRSIGVNIDRDRFTINPTNCSPFSIDSKGIGDQGTFTDFSSYFHAVNCYSLGFKPTMTIRQLGPRSQTKRSRNPHLRFDLRTRPGDANIKSIAVTLSHAFEIDQRHLGNICSERELVENECAGRAAIGTAKTTTPLLDQPLSGPVYAVSGSGGLPRLAFILNGQVKLVPRSDSASTRSGRLKTTVPVVPDAPIGHFRLDVIGGKTGYLINTRDICARIPITEIDYIGQNGKTYSQNVKLTAACGKNAARHKRHRHH